jgi:hypothetical protein
MEGVSSWVHAIALLSCRVSLIKIMTEYRAQVIILKKALEEKVQEVDILKRKIQESSEKVAEVFADAFRIVQKDTTIETVMEFTHTVLLKLLEKRTEFVAPDTENIQLLLKQGIRMFEGQPSVILIQKMAILIERIDMEYPPVRQIYLKKLYLLTSGNIGLITRIKSDDFLSFGNYVPMYSTCAYDGT